MQTLNQSQDEVASESILNRIDAMIGEMTQLRLHTMIGEMAQLRQLTQGMLTAKPATVGLMTGARTTDKRVDRQNWVEELYGSLAPSQPRSLADELDFYNSIDVGLQRFNGIL